MAAVLVSLSGVARAATVYWDKNGSVAGAGTSANGTWDAASTASFTTTADGTGTVTDYATANGGSPSTADVIFSAGSDTTSANVTLSNTVVAHSITVEELFNITATSGTPSLTLGDGGVTFASTMTGTSTWLSTAATILSDTQTWANNSGFLFTNSGTITGAASQAVTLNLTASAAGGMTLGGNLANGTGGTLAVTVNATGSGIVTFSGAKTFSGGLTLNGGILRASAGASSQTTLGAGTVTLAGGELQLVRAVNTNGTNFGANTVVTGSVQITSDVGSGSVGVNHTLGTLSIGSQTLTIAAGGAVASGTAGVTFGATTFTGNAVFATNAGTNLTLGAMDDGGTARTIRKVGAGTLSLNAAATNLTTAGTFQLAQGTVALSGTTGHLGSYGITLGDASVGANVLLTTSQNVTNAINVASGNGTRLLTMSSGGSFSGPITLNHDLTILSTNVTTNTANVLSSAISGTGDVTLQSDGSRSLTYTGTLTSNGQFIVKNNGSSSVNFAGNASGYTGTIVAHTGAMTLGSAAVVPGVGNLIATANTTLAVNSGATADLPHSDGMVLAGIVNGPDGAGTVLSASGNTDDLTLGGSGSYSFSGRIGTATNLQLIKAGTGTQTFSGGNYFGSFFLSGGTLVAASDSLQALVANGTGIAADNTTDQFTLTGNPFVGGERLILAGTTPTGLATSTVYFVVNSSGNTFQLAATENGTPIDFTTNGTGVSVTQQLLGALGNGTSVITVGDANTTANNWSPSLLTGGAVTIGRAVTIANQATSGTYSIGGNTNSNSTFSGLITANRSLTFSQVATTGNNALNITGGIRGTTVNSNGQQVLTFAGPGAINVSTNGIINGTGTGTSVAVAVTGGTVSFSAASTYSGGTSVSAGKLLVNNSGVTSGTGTGAVGVTGGTLGGSGRVTGAVTVADGATLQAGNNATGETLTLAGGLTMDAGSNLVFILGDGGLHSTLAVTGTNSFTNTTVSIIDLGGAFGQYNNIITGLSNDPTAQLALATGLEGTFSYNSGNVSLNLTAVPEPASLSLLGLGAIALLKRRRRDC